MPPNLIDVELVYAKDHNLKRDDVSALLQWTRTQHHLPEVAEIQAILVLHSCYYQIEAAKKTINNYFTCRKVTSFDASFRFVRVLPKRTPQDDMIVMMRFLDTNPSLYSCLDHIKVSVMILTLYIHLYGPAEGLIFVFEMEGVSFAHMFRLNLMACKRMIGFLQEAAPVRFKIMHYVNTGMVTGKLLAMLKPFMKKEVAEAIKLHPSLKSLHEAVPKECLPLEYGGQLPSVKTLHDECMRQLIDNLEFFRWHDAQKIDESKRIKS